MGSSRIHESELHNPGRERLQSHEELDLFMQMRRGSEQEENTAKTDMTTAVNATLHAHKYESWSCFDAGPIEAGSPLEAHVAARLASSALYRCSKPILRYASKRNNTDLLTYDMGKTDCDWLMTPPATPLMNSFEDTSSGNGEGSTASMLPTREFEDKFLSPKTVASLLLDGNKLDRASATTDHQESSSQENHVNHHTKPAISLDLPLSTTKGVQNLLMNNHRKSGMQALEKPEGEVSLRGTNSGSRTKAATKGSYQNTSLSSKETTRPAASISRFSAPPSIKTNMNMPSNSHQNTKTGRPLAPITPKTAVTSNSKQNTSGKTSSARLTTPTLYQSEPKNTANSVGKPRSTSIGRGAINVSSKNNTTKPSNGSRSTSSSRASSPEAKRNIMPSSALLESLEMPEAPPNLRTTIPKRSTSTTRGSRQPTTPTYNVSSSSTASKNTSRSVSASRGRSSSTSRSSDTRSGSSGSVTITSTTTSRGSNNNKGASNSNVLGSKMVDRVVQARRVAASSSSSVSRSSSASSASSTQTSASSSTLSVLTSNSASSSSLSVSSPSSARSAPSFSSVSSSSSLMSLSELSNKSLIKPVVPNNAMQSMNLPLDLISNRSNQMSKAKPVLGNGETQHLGMNHLQYPNPSGNEKDRKLTVPVGYSKNTQALRNFNTMAAVLMEKQKEEEPQFQHHHISEDDSDFSNELNAIMRQDKAHYYGSLPAKDIIKVSNNWVMNSPDSMRFDSMEFMHLFRQGIDKYGVSESPLVCQHGALGNCKNCSNMGVKGPKGLEEVWKPSPLKGKSNVMHRNSFELWKGSPY